VALAGVLLTSGCGSRVAPPASPTPIILTTTLPSGLVEIAIVPAYRVGSVVTVPVTITATRGSISGPVAAYIYASGIGEGGRPSEVQVRALATSRATVAAGQRSTTTLSWDGRDDHGAVVPSDAYVLIVEVVVDDGGAPRTVRAAATLQLSD
jgi:hypothetical protein